MTLGWKFGAAPTPGWNVVPGLAPWIAARWLSGRRTTSSARARCGRRRMKPRSSSPVISRWMPDLDLSASASFISSKEGETPCLSMWLFT
jgi:hypothetical protein